MKFRAHNAMDGYFAEMFLTKQLGGYNAYCEYWTAFNDRHMEVILYGTETALVVGLSDRGITTYQSSIKALIEFIVRSGPVHVAEFIQKKIEEKIKKPLQTHQLIARHEPSRVLWAFAAEQLGGEKERTYDNCFENGNGDGVRRAVEYLNRMHSNSLPSLWTVALAEKSLQATDDKQAVMCF
jgi:hypothetical protein